MPRDRNDRTRRGTATIERVDRNPGPLTIAHAGRGDYTITFDGNMGGLQAWLPSQEARENRFFGVNRSTDRAQIGGVEVHADPNVPPGTMFVLGQSFSAAFATEMEGQQRSLERQFASALYGPEDGEGVAEWRMQYDAQLRTTAPGINGRVTIPTPEVAELDESGIRFDCQEPEPPRRTRYERDDVVDEAALVLR